MYGVAEILHNYNDVCNLTNETRVLTNIFRVHVKCIF
jgi:hypothetical protein